MKLRLFDKKGRLLGKFNLFDVMVVVLIILCGVTVYVRITSPGTISRFIYRKPETKDVSVTIILPEEMTWLDKYITIGDFRKGRFGEVVATVVGKELNSTLGGDKRLFVKLKVRAVVEPGGVLTVGGRLLKIGENLGFESSKIKFKGHIIEIEKTKLIQR